MSRKFLNLNKIIKSMSKEMRIWRDFTSYVMSHITSFDFFIMSSQYFLLIMTYFFSSFIKAVSLLYRTMTLFILTYSVKVTFLSVFFIYFFRFFIWIHTFIFNTFYIFTSLLQIQQHIFYEIINTWVSVCVCVWRRVM